MGPVRRRRPPGRPASCRNAPGNAGPSRLAAVSERADEPRWARIHSLSRLGEAPMLARICWTLTAAAAVLISAVGVLSQPLAVLAGWLALGLVIGLCAAILAHTAHPGTDPAAGAGRGVGPLRAGAAGGVATVAVCLVLAGLVAIFGAASAIVLPLLLAAAGVWAWDRRRTWRDVARSATRLVAPPRDGARVAAAPATVATTLPTITPESASTPALCAAWCRSYWLLRELPPGPGCALVISTRERLLDELERRDPAGFHRWLQTGARAGSDPGRYLSTRT